jgi:hypothetical protein
MAEVFKENREGYAFADAVFGVTVKNSWKLQMNNKQYMFSCRDRKAKREWLEAFERRRIAAGDQPTAEERRLVATTMRLPVQQHQHELIASCQ